MIENIGRAKRFKLEWPLVVQLALEAGCFPSGQFTGVLWADR